MLEKCMQKNKSPKHIDYFIWRAVQCYGPKRRQWEVVKPLNRCRRFLKLATYRCGATSWSFGRSEWSAVKQGQIGNSQNLKKTVPQLENSARKFSLCTQSRVRERETPFASASTRTPAVVVHGREDLTGRSNGQQWLLINDRTIRSTVRFHEKSTSTKKCG